MVRLVRIIAIAAATVGAAVYGRNVLSREVRKRVSSEIEAGKKLAIEELRRNVNDVLRQRVVAMVSALAIKVAIVGAAFVLFSYGQLTGAGLKITVVILTLAFLARDLYRSAPFVLKALAHMRRHGWRPETALREVVAGIAFERAYARLETATTEGASGAAIALSKLNAGEISLEAAEAIADVARQASVRVVRARALIGAGVALTTSLVYGSFIAAAFHAASGA